jgi:DNA-binding SARP family transcriptional activator
MSSYLKTGELASVLRTYMRCREALANEFSSPPSIETESIYLESVRAATELSERKPKGNRTCWGLIR